MPMYHNKTKREVTIFLQNAVPVKFMPDEHKPLAQEGLEKQYASYLNVLVENVKEGVKGEEKKKGGRGLINEVRQPAKNKELTKEPVEESAKAGRKVIQENSKLSEGYSPWHDEQTVASAGRQGKE